MKANPLLGTYPPGPWGPTYEHEFNSRIPVEGALLREYDPITGHISLDTDGNQKLIKSRYPVQFIAIVTHTDNAVHGMVPGMPTLPVQLPGGVGIPYNAGDHFLVGMIDFRCQLGITTACVDDDSSRTCIRSSSGKITSFLAIICEYLLV